MNDRPQIVKDLERKLGRALSKDPHQAWLDVGAPGSTSDRDGPLCPSPNPLGVVGLPCSFTWMQVDGDVDAYRCVKCGRVGETNERPPTPTALPLDGSRRGL